MCFRPESDGEEEFIKKCLSFFMEIVTEFSFSRDIKELDEEVVKRMMNYAFNSSEHVETKPFSPVKYALDPTPVIRSFILQQLLKR